MLLNFVKLGELQLSGKTVSWVEIFPSGNFLDGNFPGKNCPDGSYLSGNFPGRSYPG